MKQFPRLFLVLTVGTVCAMADNAPPAEALLKTLPPVPELERPASAAAWSQRAAEIRHTLLELLGDLPPRPSPLNAEVVSREDHGDYFLEKVHFDNGAGEKVSGYCFLPKSAGPSPAVLYCHWHGGQYDVGKQEMLQTNATPVASGPALARAGYVVFGIDACGFGDRNGASGEKGGDGALSAAKFNLWAGRTLWGMILRDDLIALDYLGARPEVDATRIGVTGISMGSTRAWWLMALDDRLKTAVCVGCMTRYQELIVEGQLKAHGIYYFVPSMLKHFDSEAVIACSAPRPVLFQTGDRDAGSPVQGVRKLGDIAVGIYEVLGQRERFQSLIYPGVGHVYLPQMWGETVAWLDRWLKPDRH